jgi:hypothetical protein
VPKLGMTATCDDCGKVYWVVKGHKCGGRK